MINKRKFTEEEIMMYADGELNEQRAKEVEEIINNDEEAKMLFHKFLKSTSDLTEIFKKFDFANYTTKISNKNQSKLFFSILKNFYNDFSLKPLLSVPVTTILIFIATYNLIDQQMALLNYDEIVNGWGFEQGDGAEEFIIDENGNEIKVDKRAEAKLKYESTPFPYFNLVSFFLLLIINIILFIILKKIIFRKQSNIFLKFLKGFGMIIFFIGIPIFLIFSLIGILTVLMIL